jgi:hypothetical protein
MMKKMSLMKMDRRPIRRSKGRMRYRLKRTIL